MSRLPQHLEEIRSRVFVEPNCVKHCSAIDDARAFSAMHVDNSLNLEDFCQNLCVRVIKLTDSCIEFEVDGIDAPLANALRRFLIGSIPTMAVDNVRLFNNTSCMPDEIFAHRVGLVPLKVDPRQFEYIENNCRRPHNCLVFRLNVHCTANPNASDEDPELEKYVNSKVYSRDMKWCPIGNQKELFKDDPPRPVDDDILLMELRPGQHIEAALIVEKNCGNVHAKWSPVCTATYHLKKEVVVDDSVKGKLAEELVKMCPKNVFDIEDLEGESSVRVSRPHDCSMCRECIREPEWSERVKLRRERQCYIFSIESTGVYKPEDLFVEALDILISKCDSLLSELDGLSLSA